jgi:CDP-diacylglycerol--glycerol-3-phosphate 3-phosphatidyltransferase
VSAVFAYWPNRVTAIRFAGSLVLFVLFASANAGMERHSWFYPVSFWLFIVTAATDFLDGWLARRGNQITAFGRIADPFVDKVLVLGSMIFLAVMEWSRAWFPAWIVVAVLARELLVTGMRGYVESLGKEFPADWFGKIKMVIQCIAIACAIGVHAFPWGRIGEAVGLESDTLPWFLDMATHVFVWGTLVASVGSGLSYVLKIRRLLAEDER